MKRVLSLLLLSTGLVTACDKSKEEKTGAAEKNNGVTLSLPHFFRGTLPCADCGGIDTHLELRSDHSFLLEERYLSRTMRNHRHLYTLGHFKQTDNTLLLEHSKRGPLFFSIIDKQLIKMLDQNGKTIDSQLNYLLHNTDTPVLPTQRLQLRGHYTQTVNGGFFTECESGSRWLVAAGGSSANLAQNYSDLGATAGTPIFTELEGHLVKQLSADGSTKNDVIIVDDLFNASANQPCVLKPL